MHQKQRKILSLLMKTDPEGSKFSELQKQFQRFDKLSYHLEQLQKKAYISKNSGKYFLTNTGAFQFKYFSAKTLLDTEHKLPTLVIICKIKNKFLLRRYNNGSYGLWPTSIPIGQEAEEIIHGKIVEYGFEISQIKYRCSQNMIVKDGNDLVYDNIWIAYDVKLEPLTSIADSFMLLTLEDIKKLSIIDELTKEFIVENNRRPFSTKIINLRFTQT